MRAHASIVSGRPAAAAIRHCCCACKPLTICPAPIEQQHAAAAVGAWAGAGEGGKCSSLCTPALYAQIHRAALLRRHARRCRYVTFAVEVDPERPVLIDKYLDRAVELDVDALCDVEGNVTIAGIMEHIEQAGIHSGDSACSIPTQTLSEPVLAQVREWTIKIAKALNVVGLINIQFAVQDDIPYIIEANPRASR